MTTIFFFLRRARNSRSNSISLSSVRASRSTYSVVLSFLAATLRRLAGGGPSVRTHISSVVSDLMGDALPEGAALELGDGYLLQASMALGRDRAGRGDGDLDRTERGDEEGGVDRSDSGEDGTDDVWGVDRVAPSILRRLIYIVGK